MRWTSDPSQHANWYRVNVAGGADEEHPARHAAARRPAIAGPNTVRTVRHYTAMADQPMQVVFALLDARRRHDIAAVTELLDPAVVHQGVTEELVCENREEVLHNVRRSFQRDDGDIDHLELVAIGGSVIVGLSGSRFRDAPWAELGDNLFILHTVRDGHVVRMRDFTSRAEAFRAAGGEPLDWT
jgi:ketosteroid isomerase-like protein